MRNPMCAVTASALLLLVPGGADAAFTYPLKISANGRYLEDSAGVPVPILGRTAWFVTSLSVADYQTFIDDTAAKGYTAIEFHVINHDPRGNNPPYGNGGSSLPFLKDLTGASWAGALPGNSTAAPDLTTPNPAYWSFIDGLLAYCESKGLFVFMFPAYVGYSGGNQGWMGEMVANGATRVQAYGAWIATRYKNQKNIVWMMGGDMGAYDSTQKPVEAALIAGLKSVTGQQSTNFAAEWSSGSICTGQPDFGANCTLNSSYSWEGDVSNFTRQSYSRAPAIPAFLLEEPYDQEGPDGDGVNPNATQPVRRFQWWGFLSGIAGYVSGNGYIWPFNPGVWNQAAHLNSQGAQDMARLNAFVASFPLWWTLVPSGLNGMKTLITSGGSTVSAADYVAAAATSNGSGLVAYVPPAHSGGITVDMTAMAGTTRARWFDPTVGTYTTISAALPNTGTQSFTPPGNNGAGAADWVLVLDAAGSGSPPDGGTGTGSDGGAVGGSDAGGTTTTSSDLSCACSGASLDPSWMLLLLAAGLRPRGRAGRTR